MKTEAKLADQASTKPKVCTANLLGVLPLTPIAAVLRLQGRKGIPR
jgi:hypothetical protein